MLDLLLYTAMTEPMTGAILEFTASENSLFALANSAVLTSVVLTIKSVNMLPSL